MQTIAISFPRAYQRILIYTWIVNVGPAHPMGKEDWEAPWEDINKWRDTQGLPKRKLRIRVRQPQ